MNEKMTPTQIGQALIDYAKALVAADRDHDERGASSLAARRAEGFRIVDFYNTSDNMEIVVFDVDTKEDLAVIHNIGADLDNEWGKHPEWCHIDATEVAYHHPEPPFPGAEAMFDDCAATEFLKHVDESC